MKIAALPPDETKRLEALKSLGLLDSEPEKDYDDIVVLASAICRTPISLVTLLDSERQWFKAKVGLSENHTQRDVSFCSHTILTDDVMIVPDALADERFFDNPYVLNDPNIRFYAGMPLVTSNGYKIGSLCVIDREPRELNAHQTFALRTLARQVVKMAEARIQYQKLQELSQMQSKFLSIIAHDVRGPLNTISSILYLLKENALSEEEKVLGTVQVEEQVARTLDMLEGMMKWAARQIQSTELTLTTIPLSRLVGTVISQAEHTFKLKGLEVHNEIPVKLEIIADEDMLYFILRNLLANAIKFTKEGHITFHVSEAGEHWILSVNDTGIGMDEDTMKKLFRWNVRYTSIGTANEKGSGLGLLICKEFAERLGGDLSVSSKLAEGSTFSFSISKSLTSELKD